MPWCENTALRTWATQGTQRWRKKKMLKKWRAQRGQRRKHSATIPPVWLACKVQSPPGRVDRKRQTIELRGGQEDGASSVGSISLAQTTSSAAATADAYPRNRAPATKLRRPRWRPPCPPRSCHPIRTGRGRGGATLAPGCAPCGPEHCIR